MEVSNPAGIVRLARIVSIMLHPLVMIVLSAMIINAHFQQSLVLGLRNTLILCLSIAPALDCMVQAKRKGRAHHHVVLPLALIGYGAALGIYVLLGTSEVILPPNKPGPPLRHGVS